MNTQYVTKRRVLATLAIIAALAGTAVAASYITKAHMEDTDTVAQQQTTTHKPIAQKGTNRTQQSASAQQSPRCDDGNVLGAVAGGAAGGIIGSQVGRGSGKTAATIGGVLGGAYLGKQYIPLQNTTCRN